MAKQLLIMRHAKSSWTEAGKTDFERSLNKRGQRVAPEMGKFILEQGLVPDRIVSSSAVRAMQTTQGFASGCDLPEDRIQYVKYLYHAPAAEYFDLLERFDEPDVDVLMVVGHNPGLEDVVFQLGKLYETMPTGAIAHVDLGVDEWIEVRRPFRSRVNVVWRPKEIGFE